MADDSPTLPPFGVAVIGRLDDLRGRIDEVRADLKEVRATYARESDCSNRAERETNDRSASLKRIWEDIERHESRLDALEKSRDEMVGADRVTQKIWRWVLGIVAGVAGGLIVGWVMRGL